MTTEFRRAFWRLMEVLGGLWLLLGANLAFVAMVWRALREGWDVPSATATSLIVLGLVWQAVAVQVKKRRQQQEEQRDRLRRFRDAN